MTKEQNQEEYEEKYVEINKTKYILSNEEILSLVRRIVFSRPTTQKEIITSIMMISPGDIMRIKKALGKKYDMIVENV